MHAITAIEAHLHAEKHDFDLKTDVKMDIAIFVTHFIKIIDIEDLHKYVHPCEIKTSQKYKTSQKIQIKQLKPRK